MRCSQIQHGTTNETHVPPTAQNPVDDAERRRRAELAALDAHDVKVASARARDITEPPPVTIPAIEVVTPEVLVKTPTPGPLSIR